MAKKNRHKSSSWLKRVVFGQLVSGSFFKRNLCTIIMIGLLLLGYIANKFLCQIHMSQIRTLQEQLANSKTDCVNASASYNSMIRETEMKKLADTFNLELTSPDCPPYKLDK